MIPYNHCKNKILSESPYNSGIYAIVNISTHQNIKIITVNALDSGKLFTETFNQIKEILPNKAKLHYWQKQNKSLFSC